MVVDQHGQTGAFTLLGEYQLSRHPEQLLGPSSEFSIGGGQIGCPFLNPDFQFPVGFLKCLLNLFSFGDVFRDPGNAVDLPLLVYYGKGPCKHPAD